MELDKTLQFKSEKLDQKDAILQVYKSLKEKGYNPINQIAGYLLSGDPAYIPRYNNSRNIIKSIDRDQIIEELLREYINSIDPDDTTEFHGITNE